jgi:hypothetical protein
MAKARRIPDMRNPQGLFTPRRSFKLSELIRVNRVPVAGDFGSSRRREWRWSLTELGRRELGNAEVVLLVDREDEHVLGCAYGEKRLLYVRLDCTYRTCMATRIGGIDDFHLLAAACRLAKTDTTNHGGRNGHDR